jgi:hypothetical protein
MEPSDYDEMPLCKILCFVRCMGLLAEYRGWGLTLDQKVVAVHGSPCLPTPCILILILSFSKSVNYCLIIKHSGT